MRFCLAVGFLSIIIFCVVSWLVRSKHWRLGVPITKQFVLLYIGTACAIQGIPCMPELYSLYLRLSKSWGVSLCLCVSYYFVAY